MAPASPRGERFFGRATITVCPDPPCAQLICEQNARGAPFAPGGIPIEHSDSLPADPLNALNPRARRFISEYLKDLNGTQAAIRAGYAKAGARVTASRLLANVSIAKSIRDAHEEILKENQVTVARIVRELALIAFFDPASILDQSGHLLPVSLLSPEVRRGLPAFEFLESGDGPRRFGRFRLDGKLAALVALGKHMAIFSDRIGEDPTDLPPLDLAALLANERSDQQASTESQPADD